MRYASIIDRVSNLGSDKWTLHFRARQMKAQGVDLIELTIGEPDIAPETELLDECYRSMKAGRTRYSNGRGEPAVVDALVAKYGKRTGRSIGPDNILCFPGTQSALFAVMMGLAEGGDAVLVGDPLYATYEGVIRATGATQIPVPLHASDGFRLSARELEKAITPQCRVLLINSPHNPTGAVLSREDLAEIGAVCTAHDLWIVSDEVYEELIFDGEFASPIDDPDLAERSIAVSSISKSHAAPGFRSGWAIGPADFCTRLQPVSETMLFGMQPFIADMTAMALSRPSAAAASMRQSYRRRAELIAAALEQVDGVIPFMPQAGMFILLDIRAVSSSGEAFAWGLLEQEKVAVMPGNSFGDQARGFVRISLTVPEDTLIEACRRIAAYAKSLAAPALRA